MKSSWIIGILLILVSLVFISPIILTLEIVFLIQFRSFENQGISRKKVWGYEPDYGSFAIANTSEEIKLVERHEVYSHIGTTWNLSVHVHSNSTSAISLRFNYERTWIRGDKSFQIAPNTTINKGYVQHGTSDNIFTFQFFTV